MESENQQCQAYACHSLKDEAKIQSSTSEWTTEWLETRVVGHETDAPETSLSSTEFSGNQETSSREYSKNQEASSIEFSEYKDASSTEFNANKETSSADFSKIEEIQSTEFSEKKEASSTEFVANQEASLAEILPVEHVLFTKERSVPKKVKFLTENYDDDVDVSDKLNYATQKFESLSVERDVKILVEEQFLYSNTELKVLTTECSSKLENIEVEVNENIIHVSRSASENSNSSVEKSPEGESTSAEIESTTNDETNPINAHKCSEKLHHNDHTVRDSSIDKKFEPKDHDEKLNNFEECIETVHQVFAAKKIDNNHSQNIEKHAVETKDQITPNTRIKNKIELFQNNSENSLNSGNISDDKNNEACINEVQLELNSNATTKKPKTIEDLKTKKFITSSWDLVSIIKLLYEITEPKAPKICPEDHAVQTRAYILSKGTFSRNSEGYYDIIIQDLTFNVLEEEEILFSFPLNDAELYLDQKNTIILDNKMGRCLHLKCETLLDLSSLKEELETHCRLSWLNECINLVHYPLKCHQNIVIIDLGSCSTRAGILMDQPTLPTLFFPSVCATNKTTGKHVYGTAALQTEARQNSTISFPLRPSAKIIKHSVDMDEVTGIFKKIFQDLGINPSNYTVLVCLPRSLSTNVQTAMVKVLLEDLNVKSVSLAHQAILTMYAYNVSTGVVVDIGDRMDILPVIDGFIVETGVTRLPYGGQRLIHHMKHALAQKHISLSNDIDSFVVQYITENLAYIAEDYDTENQMAATNSLSIRKSVDLQNFALDINCLHSAVLDEARFKVPEGLFNPDLWGLDSPGVHKLVQKAIQTASVDARKKLAENIYCSGGVTMIPGFIHRLRKEITKLNQPRLTPQVYASHYRYHSTYIGACRFARMDAFSQVCVTKEEFRKTQGSALKKFMLC